MTKINIISSPKYSIDLGGHVFAAEKFFHSALSLVKNGIIRRSQILEPGCPSHKDLLLAHTPAWISKLEKNRLSPKDIARSEIPLSQAIINAHMLAVQGTIMACEQALATGMGLHAGGGAHHAFANHGEGFCLLNDMAVGIRKIQKTRGIQKALIIDLDAHQGNGTASIFKNSPEIFTFSMHQADIYPAMHHAGCMAGVNPTRFTPDKKETSTLDLELSSGTKDRQYLAILKRYLPRIMDKHKPEFAVYLAGADCYRNDRLAGLKLTFKGLKARDEFVFSECLNRKVPFAVVLGGGYAKNPADTIKIHTQTLSAAIAVYKRFTE